MVWIFSHLNATVTRASSALAGLASGVGTAFDTVSVRYPLHVGTPTDHATREHVGAPTDHAIRYHAGTPT